MSSPFEKKQLTQHQSSTVEKLKSSFSEWRKLTSLFSCIGIALHRGVGHKTDGNLWQWEQNGNTAPVIITTKQWVQWGYSSPRSAIC